MELEEKKVPICRRCRRKLKTPEAIERGMGKVCWQKSQTSIEKKPLFSADVRGDKACRE